MMMSMRKRRKVMRQKMNKDSCIIQTVNLVVGHLDTVIVMMDGDDGWYYGQLRLI